MRPLADGWGSAVGAARVIRQAGGDCEVEMEDLGGLAGVIAAAAEHGGAVHDVGVHRPNLADAFFALTGRALRDDEERG